MSSISAANEAIKRNRNMMRGPSMYKNMKQYHNGPKGHFERRKMTKEEKRKIKIAKRKGIIIELKYYMVSMIITGGLGYVFYKIFIF